MTVNNLTILDNLKVKTSNLMPVGSIIMWTGTTIPDTWALCDGTQNTPDLRGRFIIGAGQGTNLNNRTLNTRGGYETHTLIVDELPDHKHSASKKCMSTTPSGDWSSYTDLRSDKGWNCIPGITWTNATGNSKPYNIMPPFYVLAYIMKQ